MARRRRSKTGISLSGLLVLALVLAIYLWQSYGADRLADRTGESERSALSGQTLLVAVLDVGQGDAIVVKSPAGKSMLIDAGNEAADAKKVILPFLKQQGISKLDYLVMTHPDQDHVGGIPTILDGIKVDTFLDPVLPDVTNRAYLETLTLVKEKKVKAVKTRSGKTAIDLGPGVEAQVLGPEDPLIDKGDSTDNNNSIVLRLTQGKISFLLTGDIEPEAEERILGNRQNIRSQILKVAHHGSRGTTTDRFLEAIKPEVALISAGKNNRFGHPHAEALKRLEKHEAKIYRTDLQGSLLVRSDGEKYSVETTGPAR